MEKLGFKNISLILFILLVIALLVIAVDEVFDDDDEGGSSAGWTDSFDLADYDLSTTGENEFFILKPGYQIVLEGEDDGENVKVIITVLNETKVVDGVETGVVEEREFENDELVEVSLNYFAICNRTKSVFYFGEDSKEYEDGKVVSTEGSWLAGENGAKAGLIMPGMPLVGSRYYQEIAPGVAMDRGEIISMKNTVKTPAGTFQNCLKVVDSSAIEKDEADVKFFAPGIGIVQDEELKLTSYGYV
ncbi:MAG: hypothetical protein KAU14_05355 [Thermoplasmata archaeon]|nr:hypothetical protein [Thermoplasmata archaeon]